MRHTLVRFSVVLLPMLIWAQSQQHGLAQAISDQDTVYYVSADEWPEPVGGLAAISKNIRYPQSAKKDKVEGTVYVEVFIDEGGKVLRTGVVRGVRADLDKAAVAAISNVRFTPGAVLGKPVKVRISIPIRFRLNGVQSQESVPAVDKPTVQIIEGPSKLKTMIEYPRLAILAGIQGEVFVTVILNDDQNISELKVVRGIGAGCENAVLRALAGYGFPIDPGYRGKTQMELSVIVNFKLPPKK